MGNESSTVDPAQDASERRDGASHLGDDGDEVDEAAAEFRGFRVLGIQEQSPAARVGFVSFFDFILSANSIRLDTRDSTFMELIAQSEDQPMQLQVYNTKSQTTRELMLTPSRKWPGKGLLGVTIRFDSYEHADDQLLHVLDVVRGSPGDDAGLKPETDYLLGTPERVFRDPDDLHDEILEAMDDSFQCYVYNSEEDQVRIVRISPNNKWGDGGVLGAEVGHGVLHRLPSACRATFGTSVGFVSLSAEAKAATDPYLRQLRAEETEDDRPTEDPHKQQVEKGKDVIEVNAAPAEPSGDPQTEPSETSSNQPEETEENAELSADASERAVPVPSGSPVPVPVAPPPKPRYAARIDPRFPMSTVAVLADPAQVK